MAGINFTATSTDNSSHFEMCIIADGLHVIPRIELTDEPATSVYLACATAQHLGTQAIMRATAVRDILSPNHLGERQTTEYILASL